MEGSNPPAKNSVNYDLTPEEIQDAIKEAARKKMARMKLDEHWAAVKAEPIITPWTTEEFRNHILLQSKEDGKPFVVDSENEGIWKLLTNYFSGNDRFEENGHSLNKGILLHGPVGCGKTFMMHLLRMNYWSAYRMVDCTDIAAEASDKKGGGDSSLIQYFTDIPIKHANRFGHEHYEWCFDDLGTEPDSRHFGNQLNVMERIIECRYKNKALTHIITNLTVDEITTRYGIRVRDRLKEMCNVVKFPATTKSRRK